MARRLTRVVLAAALVTGVFVALSESASAAEENACKVLKSSEIAKIVGFEAAKGKGTKSPGGASSCTWELTAPGAFIPPEIAADLQTELAENFYESARDTSTDGLKVKGLGKAFYDATFTQVNILKDDVYFTLSGKYLEDVVDPAVIQQRLVDLAKKARKRL